MRDSEIEVHSERQAGASSRFMPIGLLRDYFKKLLGAFRVGSIHVRLPNGEVIRHQGPEPGPAAAIVINRWRLLGKLIMEGDIGLARAYVDGDWATPDLRAVLDFGVCNEAAVVNVARGIGLAHVLNRFGHRRNANTRGGSQRNIAAHYDLGNAFYEAWLDRDLVYSSAIFANNNETLEVAQDRKLRRVIALLELGSGDRVLEIGCGWGGLARRIVEAGAGHVTGISLSSEQISHAQNMLKATGYSDRVEIEHRDYRDVTDRFDRIVSIEMFEAVGEKYWPVFFEQLNRALNEGGVAVLQIITIADHLFDSYKARPDFIQQYIFPGGMLPTVGMVREQAARAGFRVELHEPFGASYGLTLRAWQRRFDAAWPEIERMGFDDRFRRMWDYYLNYCEVGFRRGSIDVGLFRLVRTSDH